ncbi:MAG: hypothetical protein QOK22_2388 [Gaiellaceae bacterium]|nr:hypothetical protein [Gaiellaceae bacterium]
MGAHRVNERAASPEISGAAFACAPTGIAVADSDGIILDCNDAFARIVGRDLPELVGSSFPVLLYAEDREGAEIAYRHFLRGHDDTYETTLRYRRPDDREVLLRACVRADRSVVPPRAVAVVEDVSEDGKLLAASSRREDRFRSMIENATDMLAVCDREGRVTYQSPSISRFLGWTEAELAEHAPFELVHPDDRERCGLAFQQMLLDGERVTTNYRVRHKDGRWLQLEATGSNLLDDPSVGGIVINSRDVTESQFAQQRLRQAEEQYRTLVEQLPLVVYATSAREEGDLIYISPQVTAMLGFPVGWWESGRHNWEEALHPDDRVRVISEVARQRGTSDRIRIEYRLVAADGRIVWVIDDMALLRDADGQPRFYQGFLLDITERETLQEQLRHAQRLEAVGRLAGGIAHDFNNMLMGIMGYSDLAAAANAEGDTERVQQDVERIRAAADRAKSLTHQLLAFSRKQVLREQTVDTRAAIAEVLELLGRVLGEDVEIVVEADPDVGSVNVDPAQFEQLLVNLAINARDAMPDGGTLTIAARRRELGRADRLGPGRYIAISVADTGTGMDDVILSRLFEPFFTTKPKGQGTGLGLASAHGFIKQSGGDIRVSSSVGRGSVFEILLPEAGAHEPSTKAAPEIAGAVESNTQTSRIMLVEDDKLVRKLVGRMLELYGHTVQAFSSAEEAEEALSHTSCDLLITDVVMPGTSGLELTQHVRGRSGNTRVLLMSGYSDESVGSDVLREQYVSFIQKPFTAVELGAAVEELLQR